MPTERTVNAELAATLAARTGLDVRTTETGGGCTALMATLTGQWHADDTPQVLITAGLDPSFPLHESGEYLWGVFVGGYPQGGAYDEPTELLSIGEVAAEELGRDTITERIASALTTWRDAQPKPDPEPTPAPDLTAALAHLAGVFGDLWTAGYTGTHMTCGEADALARVLALAGHRDDAARWLMGHADGDDDARHTELAIGDHDSRKAADIAEFLALAAARAYVAKLTRE